MKSFTYLGPTIVQNGTSEKEIRIRIGRETGALVKLDNIWKTKDVTMKNKLMLLRSIVLANLLYACGSWTISRADEQRIRAMQMKSYRRLLGVTWKDRKTNEWKMDKIKEICGYEPEDVMDVVKRRKLKYFGHLVLGGGTGRAVMEGGMEGSRGRGGPRRNWMGNITELLLLLTLRGNTLRSMTVDREGWRKAITNWVHPRPPRLWSL